MVNISNERALKEATEWERYVCTFSVISLLSHASLLFVRVFCLNHYSTILHYAQMPTRCTTTTGEKLRKAGSTNYTRIREIIFGKLEELGYDPSGFGFHSFYSSGATLAANAGVHQTVQLHDSLLCWLKLLIGLAIKIGFHFSLFWF